jgi:hypothetical protein
MLNIVIPSKKIIQIITLIKKIVKYQFKTLHIPVVFTSQGLYATVSDSVDFQFFVPVSLDIGNEVFGLSSYELSPLLNTKDDVISISQTEQQLVTVHYTNHNVPCTLFINRSDFDTELLPKIPTETMESSLFLETLTKCFPFTDKDDESVISHNFCLAEDNIVATNGCCLCAFDHIDIPFFKMDSPFLLSFLIMSVLPKLGTCQLAKVSEKKKLYIGLSDFHIWVKSTDARYPKWKNLLPEEGIIEGVSEIHKLTIDRRDADAFLNRVDAVYKSINDDLIVHWHFEDGVLCADTHSSKESNIRFCFSENTVGSTPNDAIVDVKYLKKALPLAAQLRQKSVGNKDAGAFVFESKGVCILLMPCFAGKEPLKPISHVIHLKDYWVSEKPVKKPAVKKQSCSVSVSTNSELIAKLRLENEQLRKENEQLRQLCSDTMITV